MQIRTSACSTVNVFGQFVLSDPCVVVHLFSKRAPRACTARPFLAQCVLAEQMYHLIRDAKSLLGTSHSAYVATSTESDGAKIDGFLYPNFM